jgi:hypothetical protein
MSSFANAQVFEFVDRPSDTTGNRLVAFKFFVCLVRIDQEPKKHFRMNSNNEFEKNNQLSLFSKFKYFLIVIWIACHSMYAFLPIWHQNDA